MPSHSQPSTDCGVTAGARTAAATTLIALVAIPLVLLARVDRSLRSAAERRPQIGTLLADPSIYPPSMAGRVRARDLDRPTLVAFFRAGCAKCERTAATLAGIAGREGDVVAVHAVVEGPAAGAGSYFGIRALHDDGSLAARYGVVRTPIGFLVAADTRVLAVIEGERDEPTWLRILHGGGESG